MFPMRPHQSVDRDHVHDHPDHDHLGRAHVHAPASFGMAFAVGIGLNLTFVVVEFTYGVLANSVALIADAGHTSPTFSGWSLPGLQAS
jgi:cobalt-zinc-cadmium efflux system protein